MLIVAELRTRRAIPRQILGGQRRFVRLRAFGLTDENFPFAAPVVIAHQRPDAFDDISLRGHRIEMRCMPATLTPELSLAVERPGVPAIVEAAIDAFLHTDDGFGSRFRRSRLAVRAWVCAL